MSIAFPVPSFRDTQENTEALKGTSGDPHLQAVLAMSLRSI